MRISDWSSDVCSSDLAAERGGPDASAPGVVGGPESACRMAQSRRGPGRLRAGIGAGLPRELVHDQTDLVEVGRASCRERVCQYGYIPVVTASFTQTKINNPLVQLTLNLTQIKT